MKKLTIILAALALLASCAKDEPATTKKAVFKFSVTDNSMTRVPSHSDILEALESRLPEYLELTVLNTSTQDEIQIRTGEAVDLDLGEYKVTAVYKDASDRTYVDGYKCLAYSHPVIEVNEYVTITYDKTEYELKAYYNCFSLAIDPAEAANIAVDDVPLPLFAYGDVKAVFVSGDLDSGKDFVVNPASGAYKKQTYTLYKPTKSSNGYLVKDGYYYLLRATEVTSIEGGSFGYSIDEWKKGSL